MLGATKMPMKTPSQSWPRTYIGDAVAIAAMIEPLPDLFDAAEAWMQRGCPCQSPAGRYGLVSRRRIGLGKTA